MIKVFAFNHYQVNCSVLFDEKKQCVIVDCSCQSENEKKVLLNFIEENSLKVKHILLTHPHVDHICGAGWACKEFSLPLLLGADSKIMLPSIQEQASMMGFYIDNFEDLKFEYIDEKTKILYGDSTLRVFSSPGHCIGSLCFYNEKEKFVLTGDLLFKDSVGRTDLPTGNYDLLVKSIKENLFTLPNETICVCGHGPNTTIGYEKENNPFVI
ncbi:MAG: MBL fold metallo-hydrolase [Bacteroidales bacterium]|jgi:glyoxylase-like metal-dependent hydrolase (beta-lactamase superfamily II)|nr:MBL fold metallo-hydrolase [Bacteroidales bacterium]